MTGAQKPEAAELQDGVEMLSEEDVDSTYDETRAAMAQLKALSECPPFRPQLIHDMVETVARYNPDNIPVLEAYLDEQMATGSYDLMANLALLKLYQLNPTAPETLAPSMLQHVGCALVKALMAVPAPDFDLCVALLHPPLLAEPLLQELRQLQSVLEGADFVRLWALLAASSPTLLPRKPAPSVQLVPPQPLHADAVALLEQCHGFTQALRDAVATAVGVTYRAIETARLARYLNQTGAELESSIAKYGWTHDVASGTVLVPAPAGASDVSVAVGEASAAADPVVLKKAVPLSEDLKLEQLAGVIGYSHCV